MTMSEAAPFDGAKIAILRARGGDLDVLTLLRDDIPTIPYPNEWDLPGGGREGDETPFQTAARELHEELFVQISEDRVIYHVEENGHSTPNTIVHFFVARWDDLADADIHLGDEGQDWQWMPAREFATRADAVISLRQRLNRALNQLGL